MRLSLLPVSTMRVLLALAVLMAWCDPYVLWQAGYWLSFVAVALLLEYEDRSHHPHIRPARRQTHHRRIRMRLAAGYGCGRDGA